MLGTMQPGYANHLVHRDDCYGLTKVHSGLSGQLLFSSWTSVQLLGMIMLDMLQTHWPKSHLDVGGLFTGRGSKLSARILATLYFSIYAKLQSWRL